MDNMTTIETTIPFNGFYESISSDLIDDAIQQYFSNLLGEELDVPEWAYNINFKKIRIKYSQMYVQNFVEVLNENYFPERPIVITFKKLTSPREYNFETDRIYVTVSVDDFTRVRESTKGLDMAKTIRDRFSHRSGFISFYSNDIESLEWKKETEDLDHNEAGTYLECLYNDIKDEEPEHYMMDRNNSLEDLRSCVDGLLFDLEKEQTTTELNE